MAKIRKITETINGSRVTMEVYYQNSRSFFYPKMPQSLMDYAVEIGLPSPYVTGKTEGDMLKLLRELIVKFESSKMVEKKIITYFVDWISRNVPQHNKRDSYGNNGAARIMFRYAVLIERDVDGKKKYYELDGKCQAADYHSLYENGVIHMDWTPEREQFMKDLYEGLESLMLQMKHLVGTEELMLKATKNGLPTLVVGGGQ